MPVTVVYLYIEREGAGRGAADWSSASGTLTSASCGKQIVFDFQDGTRQNQAGYKGL